MAVWSFVKKVRPDEPARPIARTGGRRLSKEPKASVSTMSRQGRPIEHQERSPRVSRLHRPTQDREIKSSLARARDSAPIASDKTAVTEPVEDTQGLHSAHLPILAGGLIRDADLGIFAGMRRDAPHYHLHDPRTHPTISSEQRTSWQRIPTLRAKRRATEPAILRRKSSKKKKKDEDDAREAQIRQLSVSAPNIHRAATHSAGGPLRRDSKKMHGGLNRNLQRPISEISLPVPESMHSAMSGLSDQQAFRVKAFDLLSPRPTIRCSENERHTDSSSRWDPSRTSSKRARRPATIDEQALDQNGRIEELADHLDASDLRTLMDRDERRRERKRKLDHEKLQRRLTRRAEKQRLEDQGDEGGPSGGEQKNLDRGALGREALGPENPTAVTSQGEQQLAEIVGEREGMLTSLSWLHDSSTEGLQHDSFNEPAEISTLPDPIEHSASAEEELDVPVIHTAKAVRLSQASMTPPSISPLSKSIISAEAPTRACSPLAQRSPPSSPHPAEGKNHASGLGARQSTAGWSSLFRRGTKTKSIDRGRLSPSEFSNTSRDSLTQRGSPAVGNIGFAKRAQPLKRTTSKFREDLPEMPISLPTSRIQSVEPLSSSDPSNTINSFDGTASLIDRDQSDATSPAAFDPFADQIMRHGAATAMTRHLSSEAPSIEGRAASTTMSQSLASIDSEGSWLSGRPAKRVSTHNYPTRTSNSSLQKRMQDLSDSGEGEEMGVGDDEYLSRLTPAAVHDQTFHGSERPGTAGRQSSNAMGSDPTQTGTGRHGTAAGESQGEYHGTVEHKPLIVTRSGHAKSREGLLNDSRLLSGEDGDEGEFDDDVPSPEFGKRSFEYPATGAGGGDHGVVHVRRISAGSARLLDIVGKPGIRDADNTSVNSKGGRS